MQALETYPAVAEQARPRTVEAAGAKRSGTSQVGAPGRPLAPVSGGMVVVAWGRWGESTVTYKSAEAAATIQKVRRQETHQPWWGSGGCGVWGR